MCRSCALQVVRLREWALLILRRGKAVTGRPGGHCATFPDFLSTAFAVVSWWVKPAFPPTHCLTLGDFHKLNPSMAVLSRHAEPFVAVVPHPRVSLSPAILTRLVQSVPSSPESLGLRGRGNNGGGGGGVSLDFIPYQALTLTGCFLAAFLSP